MTNTLKSTPIVPQAGAKPISNLTGAMEHINRIFEQADKNQHSPEIVKTLLESIAAQFHLTQEQVDIILATRTKSDDGKTWE